MNKLFLLSSSKKKKKLVKNDVGIPGAAGFGVGIAPVIPAELEAMEGTTTLGHDNYGNYKVKADNSIMVWIPKFYYKITNVTDAPYYGTKIKIAAASAYADETAAAADGYALHRAFIDGGAIKDGFFVDKYSWSLSGVTWSGSTQLTGIASSIKNGNPISSSSSSKRIIDGAKDTYAGSFSNCISNSQTPTDNYLGAWSAAKSRGSDFAVTSMYVESCLALLSLAHGQASSSAENCGWYHATNNFPKGNNNYGADASDAACTFSACDDGYWASRNEARKTGSAANTFSKSTHNGQNCGVSDMNGNQWTVCQGLVTQNVTSKAITGITRAAEAVFTVSGHGYSTDDVIQLTGAFAPSGWNSLLQNKFWKVTKVDNDSFKLRNLPTDAFVNTSALADEYTTGYNSTTGTFHTFKESLAIKDVTGANHYNGTYIAANFDAVVLQFNTIQGARFGNSTEQVLSGETTRTDNAFRLSGLGLPMSPSSVSSSGSNSFGQDYYYENITANLCPIRRGYWNYSSPAGAWSLYLINTYSNSTASVSGRSCLYV